MTVISNTLIATTDPVTIKDGIPLHRDFPTANLGFGFGYTFWDTSTTILGTLSLATRAAITLEGGILGPNYGGRMEVTGTQTGSDISLEVSLDEFEAGMVIGVVAGLELQLEVKEQWGHAEINKWKPWKSHWVSGWTDLVNTTIKKEIDLIPMLIDLTLTIGGLIPGLKKIVACLPKNVLDGMRDSASGIMGNDGTLVLHPHLVGQLDLITLAEIIVESGVELIPYPPLIPIVEALAEVNDITSKFQPTIALGPVFGIDFPVKVSITKLKAHAPGDTNGVEYSNLTFVGDTITGSSTAPAPATIEKVGVEFTHSTGVDIVIGWYMKLSWFKIFSLGRTNSKDLFSLLGIDTTNDATKYTYEMQNGSGATSTGGIEVRFVSQDPAS